MLKWTKEKISHLNFYKIFRERPAPVCSLPVFTDLKKEDSSDAAFDTNG